MVKKNKRTEQSVAFGDETGTVVNTWVENLGKYLLDISKYVTTGVVISSLFKDVADSTLIYVVGTVVAVSTLIVGLILTNKKKKMES